MLPEQRITIEGPKKKKKDYNEPPINKGYKSYSSSTPFHNAAIKQKHLEWFYTTICYAKSVA